ncbi:MAG: hypothetical protein IPL53_21015 [Ignavibacteria bacterium]|nr:hypothetical protein [Ignavibacteria bacterium]
MDYTPLLSDANTGWAVGEWGTILKTVTGGTVSISQTGSEIPERFELKQNFPNPFNPATKITFDINTAASRSNVTLKVYDIIGRGANSCKRHIAARNL